MFKLMHKKLNKKGFTLAELLVVVAVVAILVAIAIPIFTESMKDAQIRTNEANIRSTKSAAVSYVLAHWNEESQTSDGSSGYYKYKDGAKKDSDVEGWHAIGQFDDGGNLINVTVGVGANKDYAPASVSNGDGTADVLYKDAGSSKLLPAESYNLAPAYFTYVYIKDTEIKDPA